VRHVGLRRALATEDLDICPPGLAVGGTNPFARVQPVRPGLPPATAGENLPASIDAMPYDVTVLVTLGTVVNDAPGVFEAVLAGLRDERLNVVVTVGPDRSPAELGPQPAHVVVERYLPYSLLMPRVDAVVSHAGAGTLLGTLAAGLPSVLLPHGAEQFVNAASASAAGVAEMVTPDAITPSTVRALLGQVLDEPRYRSAAWQLQAEIGAMPTAADVLAQPSCQALVTPTG
jgi:MGT family glycosyltransferase